MHTNGSGSTHVPEVRGRYAVMVCGRSGKVMVWTRPGGKVIKETRNTIPRRTIGILRGDVFILATGLALLLPRPVTSGANGAEMGSVLE